jgi:polysaccharide export outer membrane protein
MRNVVGLLVLFLVANVLSGCAPSPALVSSPEEKPYTIIAGDVLQITVWKEDSLDREVVVLPDGTIGFPLIGAVEVQGKTPEEAQAFLKQQLVKYVPDASVTVVVKAALGHTVNVIGQVTKPGEIIMSHHMTVMQALSQAGGLTPYANERRVIVLRRDDGKEQPIPVPYDDLIRGYNLDRDIVLSPGDVVVVPTAGLF